MFLIISVIAGAAWRRSWGAERPSWAFPGYRALQAALGFFALAALCSFTHAWWEAPIRAALAIAFLTESAQSLPFIWHAWDDLDSWRPLPKFKFFEGWSTYAEATCGACVWLAVVV